MIETEITQEIKVKVVIEKFEDVYTGFMPAFKGIVVQGDSIEEVKKELGISLKVQLAYEHSLDI